MRTILLAATAALIAAPAIAQQAPAASQQQKRMDSHMAQRGPMFSGMSDEGRRSLFTAMRSTAEERGAAKTARDRINALVAADTLDAAALRRAMDDERQLMDQQRVRRQTAMLTAIEKLSTADRKAFAASASRARAQVEARTNAWRNRPMQNKNRPDAAPGSRMDRGR